MSDVSVDLSGVYSALNTVNSNIRVVADQVADVGVHVEVVAREQADTRLKIDQLYEEFQEYVEKDYWTNEVSTARQELGLIRDQLQKEFGHHQEVRRMTTGILQAADLALVRQHTVLTATEELVMNCPGYWLAPALQAVSGWICDDRPLADKAVATAIARDDSKASLFFSLLSRRAKRSEACGRWLERYLLLQNPMAMDREVVVMLDALANGVFGAAALAQCRPAIDQWLAELEEQAGFQQEQRKRWAEALDALTPQVGAQEYPTLREYSDTWPHLQISLSDARRNGQVLQFFERIFAGELSVPPALETAVDEILTSLVSNFDDPELPLKRKERFNEIVIEVDRLPGRPREKKAEVARLAAAEAEALKEQTSFAAMLTNAAMYPDRNGATQATRRYAVSVSRAWVIDGFNDIVGRDRARVPTDVAIEAGSWSGHSRDGGNEPALVADLGQHYSTRITDAVNAVALSPMTWIGAGAGAVVGLMMATSNFWIGLVVLAAAAGFLYYQYTNLENIRAQVKEALEKERDEATRIVRAALAELVDLRREIAKEDARSADVLAFLTALSAPQFVMSRPDQGRAIMS